MQDPDSPILQGAVFPAVMHSKLHNVLGNIVRGCASSLLGSYVHQELI